ncbi:MAG TPA: rhodanese-like domain-containing protein [Bacillota bacterium]|jgi:rhodanese-related sulfurtransferase|nr:rhodanese-like domain-containing protein [Bacillota bacterium]HRS20705.1 rhodanese-like domain-containing protein [Clostridia bacterium]HRU40553.1 rhodanese-like domain-containing protein [Candidatus Diapherotrites archaeon]HQE66664.1 rhodanese-like domain-containing protein [Bacillota bacterium]HQI17051.1 rhodanese-like domain-containing protein [Bacillota bacterium]
MKRIVILLLAVILGAAVFSACGTKPQQNVSQSPAEIVQPEIVQPEVVQPESISPEEAYKRLESEEDIILLDVRSQGEYEEQHIPGSISIPVNELEKRAEAELTDKNADIIVYCASGKRSTSAANILAGLGYTKVYNLGGIMDWPYEVESGK